DQPTTSYRREPLSFAPNVTAEISLAGGSAVLFFLSGVWTCRGVDVWTPKRARSPSDAHSFTRLHVYTSTTTPIPASSPGRLQVHRSSCRGCAECHCRGRRSGCGPRRRGRGSRHPGAASSPRH